MKYNNYILAIFLFSSFNFSMNLSLVDFDDPSAHHILDAEIINDVTLGEAELRLIKIALERTNRNVSKAARELGITRMALRYRIKKYNL